jgi:hypothetical protein
MYITTEVDIDIDQVLSELNTKEKEQLCQELIDDGYGPEDENQMTPETYTEQEFLRLMNDIWQSRIHLTSQDVDQLRTILRDKNVI